MDHEKIVEACARAAHEVNRAYCLALGDESQTPWESAPEWQKTSARNGVAGALSGNTPEQSHEGWLAEKRATGWKYGPVKDPEKKEHPCFVPYAELPEAQRAKDFLFTTTVRTVAEALGRGEEVRGVEAKMKRGMGARPPPGMEWMVGRTVREIDAIWAESEASGRLLAEVASSDEWKRRLPKRRVVKEEPVMTDEKMDDPTFDNEVVCPAIYKWVKGDGPEPYSPTVASLTVMVCDLIRRDRERRARRAAMREEQEGHASR